MQTSLEILTAVIGVAVVYIAWNQHVTNKTRLKHELFERRFEIYEATRSFIHRMETAVKEMKEEDIIRMEEELKKYQSEILPTVFLLRRKCSDYLQRLHDEGVGLLSLSLKIRDLAERLDKIEKPEAAKELMEHKEVRNKIVIGLSGQLSELNQIFEKDLSL